MKFLIVALLLFTCGIAFSQEHPEHMTPGRTMETEPAKKYADSAEFAKLFKELYPTIKPEKPLKEQADQYFQAISRSFKMMGIDSAEAAKAAFNNLDPKAYEKTYFDTYRKNLTAKELKKYMDFVKTPEGKHISEVWSNLQRASTEANMYLVRTMNSNLAPIRQAAHERMMKEHPPEKHPINPGSPAQPGSNEMFDERNAGSKDSLIRAQQLQNKLPKKIDSLATPQPKQ